MMKYSEKCFFNVYLAVAIDAKKWENKYQPKSRPALHFLPNLTILTCVQTHQTAQHLGALFALTGITKFNTGVPE